MRPLEPFPPCETLDDRWNDYRPCGPHQPHPMGLDRCCDFTSFPRSSTPPSGLPAPPLLISGGTLDTWGLRFRRLLRQTMATDPACVRRLGAFRIVNTQSERPGRDRPWISSIDDPPGRPEEKFVYRLRFGTGNSFKYLICQYSLTFSCRRRSARMRRLKQLRRTTT